MNFDKPDVIEIVAEVNASSILYYRTLGQTGQHHGPSSIVPAGRDITGGFGVAIADELYAGVLRDPILRVTDQGDNYRCGRQ